MHYVYVLTSLADPARHYTGCTADLRRRLAEHNAGCVPHTSKFTPWTLTTYTAFAERQRAIAFERYLKTGSGRAFAKRHF